MRNSRSILGLAVTTLLLLVSANAQSGRLRGRIELGQVSSEALAANLLGDPMTRNYQVYLPPSYDLSTKQYPVIYVLHGYNGNEKTMVSILRSGLDSFIRQRKIGEMIAVFVDGSNRLKGSFYMSSPVIGDFETYITRDLVNLIDQKYRTLSTRESRGVTGRSMGGWGAMHLALKFPGTFSVVVAQAGFYDVLGMFIDPLAKRLARTAPTSLQEFDRLPFLENASAALFAGLLPNLDRPGLYMDNPYEWHDGQLVVVDSVSERALEGDVQHGEIARYLKQPFRLHGIKVVHGTGDGTIPVSAARQFTHALDAASLAYEYEEHSGGHVYLSNQALPFLSDNLQGTQRYITPVQLTLSVMENGLELGFQTQSEVLYTIESVAALRDTSRQWSERTRVTGDGETAAIEFPSEGKAQFFRIRAENLP